MKRSLGSPVAEQSTNMLSCLILLSLFTPSDTQCARADLSILTPKMMQALSGSCLHIPCSFTLTGTLNSNRQIDGLWSIPQSGKFKAIYNSNGRISDYPLKITGDLAKKNCTTLFSSLKESYSNVYEFRIENAPFMASACNTHLNIQVKDTPPSPEFHIPRDLMEKKTVTFTCSAPAPCPLSPPTLAWDLQKNAQHKLEQNSDGTFTAKIQQNITLSEHNDGNDISCSAIYTVDRGTRRALTKVTLSVSYAPKNTSASVSPSAVVSAGSTVTLNCSSRAKPPITAFTWFRRSQGGVETPEFKGSVFTFNMTEGGVYYCVAANTIGNQASQPIQLTLLETDASVQLLPILGGILGFIALAALLLFVWRYKSTPQEESQTEDLVVSEDQNDKGEIHYGEIDFSRQRASTSTQSAEQPQTVYAEVFVPDKTRGSARAPAVSNDDIYAQIKKN